MNYSFQLLGPSDVALLKQLIYVFGDAFEDPATYGGSIPEDAYLNSLLGKDNLMVIVSLLNDEVVGGLVAYELEKFEQARKEIYIYDLAVALDHRRKGIATALINKLKDVARKQGAYVIFVQADKGDDPATKLYESLGTKEEVLHFDIDL